MRKSLFVLILAVSASLASPLMASARTPEPVFESVKQDGKFELRQYAPMIVASVEVTGSEGRSTSAGFRPLADYIFGNNIAKSKIDMTAPVTSERSQKIDMTAPVTSEASGKDTWRVSFVMPQEWTMETLPQPVNPDVRLSEVPGRLMAVVRFSGLAGDAATAKHEAELTAWLKSQGYVATGEPTYAYYDPPWTLPMFRRNEVMVPVHKAA